MSTKRMLVIAGCSFFSWLCLSPASAQTAAPYSTQTVQPMQPAQPMQPVRSVGLTREQLQAFSELTGDAPGLVSQRLAMDPRLTILAASAADARMSRRATGKVLIILGFTILGVGDIAGWLIMVTTPGYPTVKSGHEGQFFLGIGVGVISLGVGLALAIPGLVAISRPGDEENRALDYYVPGRRPGVYQVEPPQVLGKTITTPVFSLAF
jgi:hypothetical protein